MAGVSEEMLAAVDEEVEEASRLTSEMIETPIENLDLSVRVFNSLKRTGITTVGEVLELLEKGDEAVMSIRNFGEKSLDELRHKMQEKGYLEDEDAEEEDTMDDAEESWKDDDSMKEPFFWDEEEDGPWEDAVFLPTLKELKEDPDFKGGKELTETEHLQWTVCTRSIKKALEGHMNAKIVFSSLP